MPEQDNFIFSDNDSDELVNVRLPKADYEIMREIIRRQKTMGQILSWAKVVVFTIVGGIIVLLTFGHQLKLLFNKW